MKRRDLLTVLGGAVVIAPFAASAQERTMPVVGVLLPQLHNPDTEKSVSNTLGRGLIESGLTVGQNVAIEWRWADGHYDRLPALAADLAAHQVDVIVTFGTPGALAAKGATSTVPIVFGSVGDPVGSGLVTSLALPGGNLTGFSNFNSALAPKVLDLLSDLVPSASVVALLVNPNNPYTGLVMRSVRDAAGVKGIELSVEKASTEDEIDTAFTSIVQRRPDVLVVEGDPFMSGSREQIVALASRHAVPAIYLHLIFATVGGLMVYGVDEIETGRQVGVYAGKILRGARPAELPVQQPTKLKLIVNLKTAKALGMTVPQSILARADEVIE
jgi:putative tryptophan/tyrosine transport system substrate-binding protein